MTLIAKSMSSSVYRRSGHTGVLLLLKESKRFRVLAGATLLHTVPARLSIRSCYYLLTTLLPCPHVEWFNSRDLLSLVFALIIGRDYCIKQANKQLSCTWQSSIEVFLIICTLISIELNNPQNLQKD